MTLLTQPSSLMSSTSSYKEYLDDTVHVQCTFAVPKKTVSLY